MQPDMLTLRTKLICHDGVTMLNNVCSAGSCSWNEEVGSPYCAVLDEKTPEETNEPDAVSREWCGPNTLPIDAQCGPDMEDGDMACDADCNNIVSHVSKVQGC